MVKPRWGSGARSIHRADDAHAADFFVDYIGEPAMVQRFMDGPEFSIDVLCDLDGRCLNAIPRTMIESRGGESIKGTVIADPELIYLGRRVAEALGVRGPATDPGLPRPRDRPWDHRRQHPLRRRVPRAMYAALPGRTYPELIVRMARGRGDRAARRRVPRRRHVHALLLAARARRDLRPTGRDIVDPPGPPAPRSARSSRRDFVALSATRSTKVTRGRYAVRRGLARPPHSTRRRTRRSCASGAPG